MEAYATIRQYSGEVGIGAALEPLGSFRARLVQAVKTTVVIRVTDRVTEKKGRFWHG